MLSTISKSMNSITTLTDGVISIEGGGITFADGSVLNSITDIALKSANNTFSNSNTFLGNIVAPTTPTLATHLTNKSYVDTANALKSNIASPSFTGNITVDRVVNLGDANHPVGKYGSAVSNYWDTTNSKPTNGIVMAGWIDGCIGTTYGGTNTTAIYWTRNVDSGCVGIYNTSPLYRLDVNGTFRCTGVARITDSTDSSLYTNGALVVSGGVGVAGRVICNSEVQGSSFYTPTGTLTVGGASALNGGLTVRGASDLSGGLTVGGGDLIISDRTKSIYFGDSTKGMRYSGVNTGNYFGTSSFPNDGTALTGYTDGCLGTLNGGSKMVLGWNNSGCVGINTNPSNTTTSTNTSTGALVVNGGVAVGGRLNVGGAITSYSNAGGTTFVHPTTGFSQMWNLTGGTGEVDFVNIVPNADYQLNGAGFRFMNYIQNTTLQASSIYFCHLGPGLSELKSILNITNTTSNTVDLGTTPISVRTSATDTALRVAGDAVIIGNMVCTGFFRANRTIPLHDSGWMSVAANTPYPSGDLSAYLSYNETKYPYTIKINFRPATAPFPVYDITGMTFQAGNADGYSFRWVNATNYSIRTGSTTVAKYHDGTNYINATSGQYRVLIYG